MKVPQPAPRSDATARFLPNTSEDGPPSNAILPSRSAIHRPRLANCSSRSTNWSDTIPKASCQSSLLTSAACGNRCKPDGLAPWQSIQNNSLSGGIYQAERCTNPIAGELARRSALPANRRRRRLHRGLHPRTTYWLCGQSPNPNHRI